MVQERVLDVSDLGPPEPLERALEAAEALRPGEYLRMLHRREPLLLYPELASRAFDYRTRQGAAAAFEIFIWRRGDEVSEQAVRALIAQA